MVDILHSRIESLFHVAEMMAIEHSIDKLLDKIIEHVQVVMNTAAASLYVRIPGTDFLEIIGSRGKVAEKMQRTKLKFGEGIGGTVAKTKMPINVPDAYLDPRFSPLSDRQTGFKTKQILSMPMLFRNSVVGVITVLNKNTDEPFNEEDIKVLNLFCSQAAIAVYNAQQLTRHERRIETTSVFSKEITNVLGREITLTYGYLSQLSRAVGKLQNLTSVEQEKITKSLGALEDSTEQIRRLALNLSSIAQCLESEDPERFSWADFLTYFQKESKYPLCKIFIIGEPQRHLFAPKSNVVFVIDTLLRTIEQSHKISSETFSKQVVLVLKERIDMCDFCVCVTDAQVLNDLEQTLIDTVTQGITYAGIQSAIEIISAELLTRDSLVLHNVHELSLTEATIFPQNKAVESLVDNAYVLWQLSLPLATELD